MITAVTLMIVNDTASVYICSIDLCACDSHVFSSSWIDCVLQSASFLSSCEVEVQESWAI